MNIYALSDKAIAEELGQRVKSLRLRRNISQQALSDASLVSLNSIKALEAGKGKISTLIAILRELDSLDQLANFIPEITVSPIQLAKMQGRQRQRASAPHKKHDEESDQ